MQGEQPENVGRVSAAQINKGIKYKKYIPAFILMALLFSMTIFFVYMFGYSNGARSREADKNSKSSQSTNLEVSLSGIITNNWSVVGVVQDISEKSIRVKNNKGIVQEAELTSDTETTLKSTKKTDIRNISKGKNVIVLGTQADDGKVTAKMVRLQD